MLRRINNLIKYLLKENRTFTKHKQNANEHLHTNKVNKTLRQRCTKPNPYLVKAKVGGENHLSTITVWLCKNTT